MNPLIFDLESDGLLEEATQIWVACSYTDELNAGYETLFLHTAPKIVEKLNNYGEAGGVIVGHNILDFDLPLLNKLFGFTYHGKVLDTLTLSRLLNPKREGGHSLEAWGERFGIEKPPILSWDKWDNRFIHRCKEDVKINKRLLDYILEEGELSLGEACLTI